MGFDFYTIALIVGGFLILGIVIARFTKSFQESTHVEDRLDSLVGHQAIAEGAQSAGLRGSHANKSGIEKVFQIESELIQSFSGISKEWSTACQLQFEKAGWSGANAPTTVLLVRTCIQLSGVLICALLYLFKDEVMPKNIIFSLLIYISIIYFSFKLYDFGINYIIAKRYERLQRTLSFSVDLLSICVRAGYSLDRSFEIIAEEVSYYNMDLCIEFMKVSIELSVIPDRGEALRNFSRRVDLPLTKILVTGLIQSEEQGASMGQTLTHLSQDFSKQKIAEIDEMASKIPTKILLPMAVFCLPGFLIFLMGPVVANIARSSFMN